MSTATLGRWLRTLALGLAATGFAQAATVPDFRILSAHTYRHDRVYYLDAQAHTRLDGKLRDALNSGVTLLLVYDIRVLRPGVWWWNGGTIATLRQRYRLSYQPLSQRYLVDNLNSGVNQSFAQLRDALAFIDRLQGFPLLDQSLLPKDRNVVADVRLRVDTADFPLPLRVRAFFNSAWRPASSWYQCAFH